MSEVTDPAAVNPLREPAPAMIAADDRRSISRVLVFTMAVAVATAVGNLYFIQPLLGTIGRSFSVSESMIGFAASLAQVGQTLGMMLLLPLGDILDRRRLIFLALTGSAVALVAVAASPGAHWLLAACFALGVSSFTTHLTVSYAASLARPEERGRVVGTVMSGLLIGILLARTFSGFVSEYFGWRTVYVVAAAAQLVLVMVLRGILPSDEPRSAIRYPQLLTSMWQLWRTLKELRESCLYGSMSFACFGAFWITLTFHLEAPPFEYSSAVIGLFGVLGVAGAMAASLAGRLADSRGPRLAIGTGLVVLLLSFVVMGIWGQQVVALIIGVLLLDIGVQAVHISNQTRIYSIMPEARSRLNAVYVVTYFGGGAIGSAAGTWIYTRHGWGGVCVLGGSFCLAALLGLWKDHREHRAR